MISMSRMNNAQRITYSKSFIATIQAPSQNKGIMTSLRSEGVRQLFQIASPKEGRSERLTFIFLFLVLWSATSPLTAAPSANTVSQHAMEAMAVQEPNQESPFFIERQEARQALAEAASDSTSMHPLLPPRPSAQKQIKQFFSSLVSSIKIGNKAKHAPMELLIEPTNFSVADVSELNVTFKIFNTKKDILIMEFPTNQRFDILVKDPEGHIIYRWSEDRSFEPTLGLVTIDSGESSAYTEKIPTTAMKNGTTYTVEATLLGQSGYSISEQITPHETYTLSTEESDRNYLNTIPETTGASQQATLPGVKELIP